MNGEIEVLATETVIFSLPTHEAETAESKTVKIEETIVTQVRAIATQRRFARLKKSLRKGSKSIL